MLSSGYKINRAADDAVGLAISEKMRRQIRGLHQGSENVQDGISMLQTAEGALAEVHDMLQRMNELSVIASNGTLMPQDRQFIQQEIGALISEIDRVGDNTTFNEQPLLGYLKAENKKYLDDKGFSFICPQGCGEKFQYTLKAGTDQNSFEGTPRVLSI